VPRSSAKATPAREKRRLRAKSDACARKATPAREKRRLRANQEIADGRRGRGDVFGAFIPATGRAFTAPYPGRATANVVAVLEPVETWLDPTIERVSAVLANLAAHRAPDVLLWTLAHPRGEVVLHPRYAASLNLIAPWWTVVRSLALKGRRFATWPEVCQAVAAATGYWNAHRHPVVWGQRPRRHPARQTGTALLPLPA
jgi:hypothetical protein